MSRRARPFPWLLFFACALASGAAAAEEPGRNFKEKWKEYFRPRRESPPPAAPGARARAEREKDGDILSPEGMVDLVDSQTPNVVDYGAFRLNFRLYSKGGVQNHLSFGVFRRLNIGASWDVEELIGSENPRSNVPALNIKFRVYDGSDVLPAVAAGYDGQGRFFDRAADQYRERERGLYLVAGRELFLPRLEFYGGANIAKFKEGEVYGSVGASYTIENKVVLITEYDNIRKGPDNRWNAGLRIFPLPSLALDFAVRRIASNQDKERVVRINYVGSF